MRVRAAGPAPAEEERVERGTLAALVALGLGAVQPAWASPGAASGAAGPDSVGNVDALIVTARKRAEPVSRAPVSMTVFDAGALDAYHIEAFNDYAPKSSNLSFTYGAGPTGISAARTVAIRGVTGQNLMGTAGATGFYIDDTPVPDSVDPRLLDIDNVEVLKGPQGTLYGEGSLGGAVRVITRSPDPVRGSLRVGADVGLTSHGGGIDRGASLIGNLVVAPGRSALRLVMFYSHDAGYLTRTFPDPASPAASDPFAAASRRRVGDQGAVTAYGGSLSGRLDLTERLGARLRIMGQVQRDHGFQAAPAPLPGFEPVYTLDRAFDVQPTASDLWVLPSLDLRYRGQGFSVVNSTSYFYRRTRDVEDSTYGTQQILASVYGVTGLEPQPFMWIGKHALHQLTSETRLTFDPVHRMSGSLGVFYSDSRSRFSIPPTMADGLPAATVDNHVVGPWPDDLLWRQESPGAQQDVSLFGELYYQLLDPLTVTVGGRRYWLRQTTDFTADGFLDFGVFPSNPQHNRESGFDPKFGITYQPRDEVMVYASASKGFRAGGAQPFAPFCAVGAIKVDDITHVRSDSLWSYEGGAKVQLARPGVLVSVAGFHIDWDDIQQQVALPCGAYFDINGKTARVDGAEVDASGRLTRNLQFRLGLGYEHTRIVDPGALADVGLQAGAPILGVPSFTATAGLSYSRPLSGGGQAFASIDYSYAGDSRSLLNGGGGALAIRRSYALVNARLGVAWRSGELALNLRNLTNARPNLGDIGYVGYAQYGQGGEILPQVATLQPMTAVMQFRRTF